MADDLLPYYRRELNFIRQLGGEFAAKYPEVAGRLLLEENQCQDPHAERLIESFALLTARVHQRIDADLPEISEALLEVLYPHYLRPIPSLAIVRFYPDPDQSTLNSGHRIEKGSMLLSRPVNGYQCRFRTCYPTVLWPLETAAVQLDAPARFGLSVPAAQAIRLELRRIGGGKLGEIKGLRELRFYLGGDAQLYEVLFNNVREVHARAAKGQTAGPFVQLAEDCLRPVGFDAGEEVLPYPDRSFDAYRLLQEYFAFQEKFLFFDLQGLGDVPLSEGSDRLDIVLVLRRPVQLEQALGPESFDLGCAPMVNLFPHRAESIAVDHMTTEYPVVPDRRRQGCHEIYAIESVKGNRPDAGDPVRYEPFYSIRHALAHEPSRAYWHAHRRPSQKHLDAGTDVFLSLVDAKFLPTEPANQTLIVDTLCTNRDLPGKLPFGGEGGEFQLDGTAPVRRIRCLTKPTETVRPPLRNSLQWRLISHLALNYLSISERPEAFQEILKLYNFSDSAKTQQRINGITKISSERVVARMPLRLRDISVADGGAAGGSPAQVKPWSAFCRGVEVTIEFDEEKYVGAGVFLFASVLERFIGLYATLNSFVQVVATTKQREEPLRRWAPRIGDRVLL